MNEVKKDIISMMRNGEPVSMNDPGICSGCNFNR